MEKKYIIAIIMTIVLLLCANSFWLIENKTGLEAIDFYMVIILFVLDFIICLKLVEALQGPNEVKPKSKIDVVFLIIFFIILFIPMSHISDAQKSSVDNHPLADYKPLITKKNKIYYNYGKNFNNWFSDRFRNRDFLARTDITLRCIVNLNYCSNTKVTFYKPQHLMYKANFWGLKPLGKYKKDILKAYAWNVNKLQRFCDKRNIKLYFLIVPRQADFFDYPMADRRKYMKDNADSVIDYLNKHTNSVIVYPKHEMLEANKNTPVYFKTDYRWTKKGAYVGYYELMKQIKIDFPQLPVLEESSLVPYYDNRVSARWNDNLNNGQTFKLSGLPEFFAKQILDTKYRYYKNPYQKDLKKVDKLAPIPKKGMNKNQDNQFYYPNGLNVKTMVIADSFGANLMEFFPYSFNNTVKYFDNDRNLFLSIYKKPIEKYKPDILVINLSSEDLSLILNLFPNKYGKKEKK